MTQLRPYLSRIRTAGAELVVVGSGGPHFARGFRDEIAPEFAVYSDPTLESYRAVGAKRSWAGVLHPRVMWNAWKALRGGFRQRGTQGDALQLGGVFVIMPDGSMPFSALSAVAGDHPEPARILAALGAPERIHGIS